MAKVLVSLDDGLLSRIDEAARKAGLNRSAFLARAVEHELRQGDATDTQARIAIAELRKLVAGVESEEDSTDVIRRIRDER